MTSRLLTSPRGMTIEDWSAQLRIDLSTDNIPQYFGGEDWKEWARRCMDVPSFVRGGAPWPDDFTDWLPWAERVFQATS